ncbi:cupin domain-containing protein [Actinokineospora auranticolor]|uniref:Ribosomal protein L16 Arg81 hydroxylase n=1 Tax=Actinokineospora auranticolor TaxID=155976 RepID=A0A2S6GFQ4_9PSEU|nr:cupin domain-containing protein [Actinokineospora auranticolor]PPK64040.1 ribosomal protein L16 Arg81 hydroxylase [Actinokineospora auranticolor]
MTALADRPTPGAGWSAPDRPALRRCLGTDPDEFAERHWGRAPLLRRAVPGGFADLLTLADVDELLSRRGLRTPFLRVARDGAVLSSEQFTRGGGVGAEIADQVADDKVARLFDQGSTLVLQGLHRLWPPLIDFAGALGVDLGHPVQVNAYVTPPSSQGFAAHYDVHDVFVLQIAGQKRWMVHEPVHADPLRSQPWDRHRRAVEERAEEEPTLEAVLSPGDALYLPRGYLHSAKALGEVSAHLTVGVHVLTRYALVEALLALAGDDPSLRSTLPLGIDVSDPDQIASHLTATVEALGRVLGSVSAEDVAGRVRNRVWAGARPEPLGPLAQASAAASVSGGDLVRLRGGQRYRVSVRGDRVLLDVPGDQISLPGDTAPAVEALLSGDVQTIGMLPGLTVADQTVLVRRLLREGILVPVGAGA